LKEPQAGERIGQYEIRTLLGKGGMGAVYLAEDHSLGRQVALKILPPHLSEDSEIVARFAREARALAALRHPNLMHIYTVGEHEGRPYFAMEYVKGSTLKAALAKTTHLPVSRAVRTAAEMMAALDKVHEAGIVHRDVKPGNIIIDEDGRAVLMDFGLARRRQDARLTGDHTVLGTPQYMSPEQAESADVDCRADIYSLGIVLYEMLAGSPPFKGKTSFEVLRQHIESSVPAPSSLRPDVPAGLDVVLARAVAKSPDDRYRNVREMAADLVGVCPDPVLARLAGVAETDTVPTVMMAGASGRPRTFASTVALPNVRARSKRRLTAAAAAVAAALVVFIAWLMLRSSPGQRVEIRRHGAEPVRGRLVEIEMLDDGTTTAKIRTCKARRPTEIRIEEGDEIRVVHDR